MTKGNFHLSTIFRSSNYLLQNPFLQTEAIQATHNGWHLLSFKASPHSSNNDATKLRSSGWRYLAFIYQSIYAVCSGEKLLEIAPKNAHQRSSFKILEYSTAFVTSIRKAHMQPPFIIARYALPPTTRCAKMNMKDRKALSTCDAGTHLIRVRYVDGFSAFGHVTCDPHAPRHLHLVLLFHLLQRAARADVE